MQPAFRRLPSPAVLAWLAGVPMLVVLLAGFLVARGQAGGSTAATLQAAAGQAVATQIAHRVVVVQGDLLDGAGTWSSTQARGSVLVVNFWASWCPPCRAEQPGLDRGPAHRLPAQGVRFLGVNVNDQRAAARAYQEEFKISYPSLYDPSAKLAGRFELVGLPWTVIIDMDGVVGERFTGKTTEAALSARLNALLASGGRWAS